VLSETAYLGFTVATPQDSTEDNNQVVLFCELANSSSFLINEIYYSNEDPIPEWIEIYNHATQPLPLEGLTIFVNSDFSHLDGDGALLPGHYALLVPDSEDGIQFAESIGVPFCTGLPVLPNSEAEIQFTYQQNVQETFTYSSDWGGSRGVSLERFSPNLSANDSRNWSSSIADDGSSPGQQNSIFIPYFPEEAEISLTPNPFSPDDDGWEDIQIIRLALPCRMVRITIEAFDLRGRQVALLQENEISAAIAEVIWNGKGKNNKRLAVGPYYLVIQAIGGNGQTYSYRRLSYIATKLDE